MGKIVRNYLSSKDIDVPKSYYPLDEICRHMGISDREIKEYRKNSYYAAKKASMIYETLDICTFWNANTDVLESDINFFARHSILLDIAHLIELFKSIHHDKRKREIKNQYKELHYWHSFGIKKEYIKKYVETGKVPPKRSRRRNSTTGAQQYGRYSIIINREIDSRVQVPKDRTFRLFREYAHNNKLSLPEATLIAMDELMKNHPLEIDKRDDIGNLVFLKEIKSESKTKSMVISIPGEIHTLMANIIRRYNASNPNKITYHQYIINAIDEKNVRVPLKYSDPELHLEMEKQKKMQNYYNNFR